MYSSSLKAQWHQNIRREATLSPVSRPVTPPTIFSNLDLIEGKNCLLFAYISCLQETKIKASIALLNASENAEIIINYPLRKTRILISFLIQGNEQIEIVEINESRFVIPTSIYEIVKTQRLLIKIRSVCDKQERNNSVCQ
jgi:hypothetical protein